MGLLGGPLQGEGFEPRDRRPDFDVGVHFGEDFLLQGREILLADPFAGLHLEFQGRDDPRGPLFEDDKDFEKYRIIGVNSDQAIWFTVVLGYVSLRTWPPSRLRTEFSPSAIVRLLASRQSFSMKYSLVSPFAP